MSAARSPDDVATIDRQTTIVAIRRALLVGLASYGEIERLTDVAELLDELGQLPKGLMPIHPTGSANTVSEIADALRLLDSLEPSPAG